jgi:hypothetical protein
MRCVFALALLAVAFSAPASAQCNCYGGAAPALGLIEPDYDEYAAPFYNTDGNVYSDYGVAGVYAQPRVLVMPSYQPRYYAQPYDYGPRYYGHGSCGYSAGYRVC